MKGISLLCALCCSLAASAQRFTITGHITGLTEPVIHLHADGIRDSASVENGHFVFSGSVPHPQEAYLFTRGRFNLAFYLENSEMTVTGRKDDAANIRVTGSRTQQEYTAFLHHVKPATVQLDALYALLQRNAAKRDSVFAVSDSIMKAVYNPLTVRYVRQHPGSYVSLYKVKDLLRSEDPVAMEKIFSALTPSIRQSAAGRLLQEEFSTIRNTRPGRPAPDITLNTPEGKPLSVSSFKGRYLLLDFWASWCKPCRAENPALKKAYERFKGANFDILGVSLDKDAAAWKKAIETDGLPWQHVSDLQLWNSAVVKLYHIRSIPANFLIGPDGTIIARNLHGEALEAKLESVLKP